jgi:uroporphyrinogen-III synthase
MHDPTTNFAKVRVAAFEGRWAAEMERLIEKHGGLPSVSPAVREVPLEDNPATVDFAHRLMTGGIDAVLFTTGAGVRYLVDQVARHVDRQRFVDALADTQTVVRGPGPTTALKELGITPTVRAGKPYTWREVLTAIDAKLPVENLIVAVQEYGEANASLVAGLEARGADVLSLLVYEWDLPADTQPLEENVRKLADRRIDVALFTSAVQIAHVVKVAEALDLTAAIENALRQNTVIGSIGPTTSDALREHGLPVDFEPESTTMDQLVQEIAAQCGELLRRKQHRGLRVFRPNDTPPPEPPPG